MDEFSSKVIQYQRWADNPNDPRSAHSSMMLNYLNATEPEAMSRVREHLFATQDPTPVNNELRDNPESGFWRKAGLSLERQAEITLFQANKYLKGVLSDDKGRNDFDAYFESRGIRNVDDIYMDEKYQDISNPEGFSDYFAIMAGSSVIDLPMLAVSAALAETGIGAVGAISKAAGFGRRLQKVMWAGKQARAAQLGVLTAKNMIQDAGAFYIQHGFLTDEWKDTNALVSGAFFGASSGVTKNLIFGPLVKDSKGIISASRESLMGKTIAAGKTKTAIALSTAPAFVGGVTFAIDDLLHQPEGEKNWDSAAASFVFGSGLGMTLGFRDIAKTIGQAWQAGGEPKSRADAVNRLTTALADLPGLRLELSGKPGNETVSFDSVPIEAKRVRGLFNRALTGEVFNEKQNKKVPMSFKSWKNDVIKVVQLVMGQVAPDGKIHFSNEHREKLSKIFDASNPGEMKKAIDEFGLMDAIETRAKDLESLYPNFQNEAAANSNLDPAVRSLAMLEHDHPVKKMEAMFSVMFNREELGRKEREAIDNEVPAELEKRESVRRSTQRAESQLETMKAGKDKPLNAADLQTGGLSSIRVTLLRNLEKAKKEGRTEDVDAIQRDIARVESMITLRNKGAAKEPARDSREPEAPPELSDSEMSLEPDIIQEEILKQARRRAEETESRKAELSIVQPDEAPEGLEKLRGTPLTEDSNVKELLEKANKTLQVAEENGIPSVQVEGGKVVRVGDKVFLAPQGVPITANPLRIAEIVNTESGPHVSFTKFDAEGKPTSNLFPVSQLADERGEPIIPLKSGPAEKNKTVTPEKISDSDIQAAGQKEGIQEAKTPEEMNRIAERIAASSDDPENAYRQAIDRLRELAEEKRVAGEFAPHGLQRDVFGSVQIDFGNQIHPENIVLSKIGTPTRLVDFMNRYNQGKNKITLSALTKAAKELSFDDFVNMVIGAVYNVDRSMLKGSEFKNLSAEVKKRLNRTLFVNKRNYGDLKSIYGFLRTLVPQHEITLDVGWSVAGKKLVILPSAMMDATRKKLQYYDGETRLEHIMKNVRKTDKSQVFKLNFVGNISTKVDENGNEYITYYSGKGKTDWSTIVDDKYIKHLQANLMKNGFVLHYPLETSGEAVAVKIRPELLEAPAGSIETFLKGKIGPEAFERLVREENVTYDPNKPSLELAHLATHVEIAYAEFGETAKIISMFKAAKRGKYIGSHDGMSLEGDPIWDKKGINVRTVNDADWHNTLKELFGDQLVKEFADLKNDQFDSWGMAPAETVASLARALGQNPNSGSVKLSMWTKLTRDRLEQLDDSVLLTAHRDTFKDRADTFLKMEPSKKESESDIDYQSRIRNAAVRDLEGQPQMIKALISVMPNISWFGKRADALYSKLSPQKASQYGISLDGEFKSKWQGKPVDMVIFSSGRKFGTLDYVNYPAADVRELTATKEMKAYGRMGQQAANFMTSPEIIQAYGDDWIAPSIEAKLKELDRYMSGDQTGSEWLSKIGVDFSSELTEAVGDLANSSSIYQAATLNIPPQSSVITNLMAPFIYRHIYRSGMLKAEMPHAGKSYLIPDPYGITKNGEIWIPAEMARKNPRVQARLNGQLDVALQTRGLSIEDLELDPGTILSLRHPVDGPDSIQPLKVAGILPDKAGNVVIVSTKTAKSKFDADFDADTIHYSWFNPGSPIVKHFQDVSKQYPNLSITVRDEGGKEHLAVPVVDELGHMIPVTPGTWVDGIQMERVDKPSQSKSNIPFLRPRTGDTGEAGIEKYGKQRDVSLFSPSGVVETAVAYHTGTTFVGKAVHEASVRAMMAANKAVFHMAPFESGKNKSPIKVRARNDVDIRFWNNLMTSYGTDNAKWTALSRLGLDENLYALHNFEVLVDDRWIPLDQYTKLSKHLPEKAYTALYAATAPYRYLTMMTGGTPERGAIKFLRWYYYDKESKPYRAEDVERSQDYADSGKWKLPEPLMEERIRGARDSRGGETIPAASDGNHFETMHAMDLAQRMLMRLKKDGLPFGHSAREGSILQIPFKTKIIGPATPGGRPRIELPPSRGRELQFDSHIAAREAVWNLSAHHSGGLMLKLFAKAGDLIRKKFSGRTPNYSKFYNVFNADKKFARELTTLLFGSDRAVDAFEAIEKLTTEGMKQETSSSRNPWDSYLEFNPETGRIEASEGINQKITKEVEKLSEQEHKFISYPLMYRDNFQIYAVHPDIVLAYGDGYRAAWKQAEATAKTSREAATQVRTAPVKIEQPKVKQPEVKQPEVEPPMLDVPEIEPPLSSEAPAGLENIRGTKIESPEQAEFLMKTMTAEALGKSIQNTSQRIIATSKERTPGDIQNLYTGDTSEVEKNVNKAVSTPRPDDYLPLLKGSTPEAITLLESKLKPAMKEMHGWKEFGASDEWFYSFVEQEVPEFLYTGTNVPPISLTRRNVLDLYNKIELLKKNRNLSGSDLPSKFFSYVDQWSKADTDTYGLISELNRISNNDRALQTTFDAKAKEFGRSVRKLVRRDPRAKERLGPALFGWSLYGFSHSKNEMRYLPFQDLIEFAKGNKEYIDRLRTKWTSDKIDEEARVGLVYPYKGSLQLSKSFAAWEKEYVGSKSKENTLRELTDDILRAMEKKMREQDPEVYRIYKIFRGSGEGDPSIESLIRENVKEISWMRRTSGDRKGEITGIMEDGQDTIKRADASKLRTAARRRIGEFRLRVQMAESAGDTATVDRFKKLIESEKNHTKEALRQLKNTGHAKWHDLSFGTPMKSWYFPVPITVSAKIKKGGGVLPSSTRYELSRTDANIGGVREINWNDMDFGTSVSSYLNGLRTVSRSLEMSELFGSQLTSIMRQSLFIRGIGDENAMKRLDRLTEIKKRVELLQKYFMPSDKRLLDDFAQIVGSVDFITKLTAPKSATANLAAGIGMIFVHDGVRKMRQGIAFSRTDKAIEVSKRQASLMPGQSHQLQEAIKRPRMFTPEEQEAFVKKGYLPQDVRKANIHEFASSMAASARFVAEKAGVIFQYSERKARMLALGTWLDSRDHALAHYLRMLPESPEGAAKAEAMAERAADRAMEFCNQITQGEYGPHYTSEAFRSPLGGIALRFQRYTAIRYRWLRDTINQLRSDAEILGPEALIPGQSTYMTDILKSIVNGDDAAARMFRASLVSTLFGSVAFLFGAQTMTRFSPDPVLQLATQISSYLMDPDEEPPYGKYDLGTAGNLAYMGATSFVGPAVTAAFDLMLGIGLGETDKMTYLLANSAMGGGWLNLYGDKYGDVVPGGLLADAYKTTIAQESFQEFMGKLIGIRSKPWEAKQNREWLIE